MSNSQHPWYSSGYDLWVVPYPSQWFSQIDWWCQFFLSRNMDVSQFKMGQTYVADVRRFVPNKKIWVYPAESKVEDVFAAAQNLAEQLKLTSVRVFALQDFPTPDEKTTNIKWSVVTTDKSMLN